MPRTGENIYKRKDGRWEGRYMKGHKPSGQAIYGYVYAYSYKEAKEKLKLAASGKGQPTRRTSGEPTVVELSDLWLESQKARVKESTYNKYSNILRSYVLPNIGGLCIQEMTPTGITKMCDSLLTCGGKNGTGLSEKTVADILSVVRSIFQYSASMGCSCPFDPLTIRIHQKARELRILSRTDQEKLYAYLLQKPTLHNIGVLICLLTGLRIGEVCALRWEDISFENHTIYVHKTAQRIQDRYSQDKKTRVVITSPKSVSGKRVIPMPQNLESALRDLDSVKTGFVLSKDETYLMEPRVLQYHFKKILKELDIEDANFHILRHTFATNCIELGFDVKSLSEILGHASVLITMNKYVHPPMALKHENMQRISSRFAVK